MSRLPRATPVLAFSIALVAAFAPPAGAAIPDWVWETPEVIDAPVLDVPPSSATSILYAAGAWHVVYLKEGDVYHRARNDSGWEPAEPLTSGAGLDHGPALAWDGTFLHVVWDGQGQVWTRRWNGAWSPAECLWCGPNPAGSAVVTGNTPLYGSVPLHPGALVAWVETTSDSTSRINGRLFQDGAWGLRKVITLGSARAIEPSVSSAVDDGYLLVWADTREGEAQIWMRRWWVTNWGDEERWTNLPGECRSPFMREAYTYSPFGDVPTYERHVAFESNANGHPEAYVANGIDYGWETVIHVDPISAIDSSPSERPNASIEFATSMPAHFLVTWSDVGPDAHRIHGLAQSPGTADAATETLSTQGLAGSAIGIVDLPDDALLMTAWIEDRDGTPTLVARRAVLPNAHVGVGPRAPRVELALRVLPNPTHGSAALEIVSHARATATLTILDATGRRVRDLGRHAFETQARIVRWDGRDERGRVVAPGLYFAVARSGDSEIRRSFVLLR